MTTLYIIMSSSSSTSDATSGKKAEPLATQIQYKFLSEEDQTLRFRLSNVNVSVANAMRRTLLTDIPINVIRAESPPEPAVNILTNTGRLTNEILKHRLSLIPIHSKHVPAWNEHAATEDWIHRLPNHVELEIDVRADDSLRLVTTEDFRLRVKGDEKKYLPTTVSQQIFPKHDLTQGFVEFARLRPKLSDTIPGEHLHLVAQFSIGTAREDSAFNVVSKCAYQNTPAENVAEMWDKQLEKHKEKWTPQEVSARKKDFMLLDAQRHFVNHSFDFIVQTIGIYRNEELLLQASRVLQEKILTLYDDIRNHRTLVRRSDAVSMEHCYDVTLENEDYTLGNVLSYLLIETYYNDSVQTDEPRLAFCGFQKEHPHDDDSILRLAFLEAVDETHVRECLKVACNKAHAIFERIGHFFGKHE